MNTYFQNGRMKAEKEINQKIGNSDIKIGDVGKYKGKTVRVADIDSDINARIRVVDPSNPDKNLMIDRKDFAK